MKEKRKRRAEESKPEYDEESGYMEPIHGEMDVVEALRKAREELQSIKESVLDARRETRYILQTLRPRIVGVTLERIRPRNIIKRLLNR